MPPTPTPTPVDREIRFALAMNGGVSLAVWIGGVSDEVLRLCVAGVASDGFGLDAAAPDPSWSVYQQLCWAAGARVRVDVMSGASAGGMNAVFLALAWLYQKPDLGELRDLWLSAGDIAALLRDPLDADASSLMMGDDYFLPRLEEALRSLATGEARSVLDAPLDVTLTATSMVGLPKRYAQKYGDPVEEQDHRVTMRFRHRKEHDDLATSDPAERERVVHRLARACRSTASFPGAFEPSLAAVSGAPGEDRRGAFDRNQVNLPGETWLIDGGTLVNLPVEEALAAVFEMPATGAVRRVFAMIVPDPSVAAVADASKRAGEAPGLITVATHALSTIPRNQMVGQFLTELEKQNHKVQSLRTSRLALVTGAWDALWRAASGLFPVYRASRATTTTSTLLANLEVFLADVALAEPRHTQVCAAWRTAVESVVPPWLPTSLDDVGTTALAGWGRTPVRRSCVRLLHLIGEAERRAAGAAPGPGVVTPEELAMWRRRVNRAIELMGAPTLPTDRSTNLFRTVTQWDAAEGTPLDDHVRDQLVALVDVWAEERKVVGQQLRLLGGVARQVCRVLGLIPGAPPTGPNGVRLLLAMEVIETSFGGYANLVEQPVESLRIDSLATSPLDPLQRGRAAGKVAGVQLGHFGSFLKASWRANDWMWGRLDGSADLIEVLLQPVPTDRLRALWDLHRPPSAGPPPPAPTDDDALRREVRDALVRCRHADIVLEETATVVAGIERDRDAGGQTSANARALERAWGELTTPPLEAAERQRVASTLLGLNRVGAESLADQAGSDLLTRTAVTTLATATTVLHESTPKALNGVLASLRFIALVLWGFGKGAMGGKYSRTLAGLVYGIGATIVVVELLPGVTVGPVLPFGVALLLAGTVLGFLRAPFIVVPTLIFIAVPLLLREMPAADHRWSWWPHGWAFPTLRGRLPWLPPVTAMVGVVVIGLVRRPVWMRSITVDHRAVDARLVRLTRGGPATGPAIAPAAAAVGPHDAAGWRRHAALWSLLVLAPAAKTAQVLTTRAAWAPVVCVVIVALLAAGTTWLAIGLGAPAGGQLPAEAAAVRRRRFGDAIGVSWVRAEVAAPWLLPAVLAVVSFVVALPACRHAVRWILVGVAGVLLVWVLVVHAAHTRRRRSTPPQDGQLAPLSRPWWVVPLAVAGLGAGIALGAGADAVDVWPRRLLELLLVTVVAEELIFRGALFALAHRVLSPPWASFVTAVSFGLWHVGDAWNAAHHDSAGQRVVRLIAVVLVWVVAGLVLAFLRRRSRTLEGPLAGHLAMRLPSAVLRAI